MFLFQSLLVDDGASTTAESIRTLFPAVSGTLGRSESNIHHQAANNGSKVYTGLTSGPVKAEVRW